MPKRQKKPSSTTALKKRLNELEKEVATLEEQKSQAGKNRWRNIGSGLLVGLTSLFILLSISAVWLQQNIMNTDTWVAKSTAVIQDPNVRSAISNGIVDDVFQRYNVESFVANNLPEKAQPLAQPITDQLRTFADKQVNSALASETFITFWQKANRSAHEGIITSLEKANELSKPEAQNNVVYINSDSVMLNLNPVLANITGSLQSKGLSFIPSVSSSNKLVFAVAEVPNLPAVLTAFNAINAARTWLPILALLFGVAAVFAATNRRKALMAIGLVTSALLVLNVQAVYFLKYPFVTQLGTALKHSSTAAGTAIYNIYTEDLVQYSRAALAVMLLLSLFAYLSGPGKIALWLREHTRKLLGGTIDAPALVFLSKNAPALVGLLVLIAALLLVFLPLGGASFRIATVVIVGLLSFFLLSLRANAKAK